MKKIQQERFWRKWYASGAVPQPTNTGMIVDAIGTHYKGVASGHQVLTLKHTEDQCHEFDHVVVPQGDYELGQVLKRLPGNATPVHVFFGQSD